MVAPPELLQTLHEQLLAFVHAKSGDSRASVSDVEILPGHAGFSYGFDVAYVDGRTPDTERYVLRLPPPNVRFEGTADVLRQVRILGAVQGRGLPVATVRWSGDEPDWFGRPYMVVPRLPGRTLWTQPGDWGAALDRATLRDMAQQAVVALANLHALDWQTTIPEWAPPLDPATDVVRWDRFWERAADPELVKLGPELRRRLLESVPKGPRIGLFHGDFQATNHLYEDGRLVAVLDWELAGVGPVLNDLGWYMMFNDAMSWAHASRSVAPLPDPSEIQAMYAEAAGSYPEEVGWFRALAGYKFSIIGGLNLALHRRGKRDDPHWEELMPSIPRLMERALEVLDGAK